MVVKELIKELTKLEKDGLSNCEVRMLTCDDNPLRDEYVEINGVFAINNHKTAEAVYLDGLAI